MQLDDQAVSVVMPVRNAMPFLDEAVASILAQTHRNFEFLIGDDGSTDGSWERLEHWAARDSRIRLIRGGEAGLGPSGSSNWVVRNAAHDWIARMDADDISRPDRLSRQLLVLRDHPDTVIVGSLFDRIDDRGKRIFRVNREVLRNLHNGYPVAHSSILFRRDAFERAGGYRAECDFWEDRDLLVRMMRQGTAVILPEALLRYRYSSTSSRVVAEEVRMTRAVDLGVRCMTAHAERGHYEDILEHEARRGPPGAITPIVVARLAHEQLWRGDTRTIMQSWARGHSRIPWNRQGMLIRLFARWARLNPASLRLLLKLRSDYAGWRARKLVEVGEILVWTNESAAWRVARLTAPRAEPAAPAEPYSSPIPRTEAYPLAAARSSMAMP